VVLGLIHIALRGGQACGQRLDLDAFLGAGRGVPFVTAAGKYWAISAA
jgi:hypothetical protein